MLQNMGSVLDMDTSCAQAYFEAASDKSAVTQMAAWKQVTALGF
jgi:hypothetical protein